MTKLEVIETPAGHMFCPRHEVTGVRIPMRLNDVDFAKVDRGLWRAEVTDQKTGKRYKVVRIKDIRITLNFRDIGLNFRDIRREWRRGYALVLVPELPFEALVLDR